MTPPFCTAEGDGSMDSSFLMEPGCQGGYALEHFLDRCPTETFLPELFQGRPSGPGGFGGRDVWNNPPLGSPRIPESRTITSTPSSRIPSLRNRASSLFGIKRDDDQYRPSGMFGYHLKQHLAGWMNGVS
jgi:hypothetical protein